MLPWLRVSSVIAYLSPFLLCSTIADTRTKCAEGFFHAHKPSYVCKDCGLPLPRYSGLLDTFNNLLITVTGSLHAVPCWCF